MVYTSGMKFTKKGFTLIELLVVVAIIGTLATIVVASLGQARIRARDASVTSAMSSFRNKAELEFGGNFNTLCSSSIYSDLSSEVSANSGSIESCEGDIDGYRIIARLPSGVATNLNITNTVYAQECEEFDPETEECLDEEESGNGSSGLNGVCINSSGTSQKVAINTANVLPSPACNAEETPRGEGYFIYCDNCFHESTGNSTIYPMSYCWNATQISGCY